MKWSHRVDPEWLQARKEFLCASDIVKLLPTTPTGRKKSNMKNVYLSVWADKQCKVSIENIESKGAMARGHILEGFAVEEINSQKVFPNIKKLYHWDNLMLSRKGVSCSPDSLDVKMPPKSNKIVVNAKPKFMGEIKSYSGASHYELGSQTSKLELMERWQIATAFYVIESLEEAALIFYNPSAEHQMFVRPFIRQELSDEIKVIEDIRQEYIEYSEAFMLAAYNNCIAGNFRTEEDIIQEIEEAESCD